MTQAEAKEIAQLINERNRLPRRYEAEDILRHSDTYEYEVRDGRIVAADIQALITLQVVHGPRWMEGWQDALQVARQSYQPILDNLDAASDQSLFDMIAGLKLPQQ